MALGTPHRDQDPDRNTMSRRGFLWRAAVTVITAALWATSLSAAEALAGTTLREVMKSFANVGNDEMYTFCSIFGINPDDHIAILIKTYDIQGEWADGVIWKNTLKKLYENYYFWGEMLSPELAAFKSQIDAFEVSDNHRTWNRQKYEQLAQPLIEGGMRWMAVTKMRYLIQRELTKAYSDNGNEEFNWYDADQLYDNRFFFGDIGRPENGEYIHTHMWATTDARLFGVLDFNSPVPLLERTWKPTNQQTVAFIMPDENGIFTFIYYENGRLKMVFPCSPGSSRLWETPSSWLKVSDYQDVAHFYYDDLYKQTWDLWEDGKKWWPMGFSRGLTKSWYYTHIGHVTGEPASHGCSRLSGFAAYYAFYELDSNANVYYCPSERVS